MFLKLHTLDMSPSVIIALVHFCVNILQLTAVLHVYILNAGYLRSVTCISVQKNEQNFCFVTLSACILVTFRNQLTETFLYDKDNNVFSACTYNVYVIYTWELKLSCWCFKYKIDISIYKYFVIHEDWWTYRKLKQNLRNLRHFFL